MSFEPGDLVETTFPLFHVGPGHLYVVPELPGYPKFDCNFPIGTIFMITKVFYPCYFIHLELLGPDGLKYAVAMDGVYNPLWTRVEPSEDVFFKISK